MFGFAWIFGCVGFGWLGKFVARGFELIQEALLVGRDFFLVGFGFGYDGSGKRVGLGVLLEVGDDGGEAGDETVEGLCVGCGMCNVVKVQWFPESGDVADECEEQGKFFDFVFGFAEEVEVCEGVVEDVNVAIKFSREGSLVARGRQGV